MMLLQMRAVTENTTSIWARVLSMAKNMVNPIVMMPPVMTMSHMAAGVLVGSHINTGITGLGQRRKPLDHFAVDCLLLKIRRLQAANMKNYIPESLGRFRRRLDSASLGTVAIPYPVRHRHIVTSFAAGPGRRFRGTIRASWCRLES